MADSPPGSQDSVDTIKDSVLPKSCLLCGGELIGRKGSYFVCTSCNHRFSGERLISAAKPLPEAPEEEIRGEVVEGKEEIREEVSEAAAIDEEEEIEEVRENNYYESAFSRDR